MVGYFIADKTLANRSRVEKAIRNLETIGECRSFETDSLLVYFLFNRQKNNYFVDEQDLVVVSTGAAVYKNRIRNESLSLIAKNAIENIFNYDDLSGHFNLAILNLKNNNLTLYTDKEGLQSAFYYKKDGAYILSSNLLLLASQVPQTLNKTAIVDFIHIGNPLSGQTIFSEINRVPPSVSFKNVNGKWEEKREWKISVKFPYAENSTKTILNDISQSLESSIEFCKFIPSDEIVADLTGGTDTRTIVSFLSKLILQLNVFTAGPSSHIDVKIAKIIANKLRLKLTWLPPAAKNESISSFDEAIEYADGCSNIFQTLPSINFLKEKAKYFRIVFGGNGGPLFKDHYWLFEFNRINRLKEPNWARLARLSVLSNFVQNDILKKQFQYDVYSRLEMLFLNVSKEIVGTNNQKMDYVYFSRKCVDFMAPHFTLSNNFFDVFHPMLYGEIVERAINSNPQIRKNCNLQFSMIYKNNSKLAWIKTDNIYPSIPTNGIFFFLKILILFRYLKAFLRKFSELVLKKGGTQPIHNDFMDLEFLQKTQLIDYLDTESMRLKEIINESVLKEYLANIGHGSNLYYVQNILSIELFLNKTNKLIA